MSRSFIRWSCWARIAACAAMLACICGTRSWFSSSYMNPYFRFMSSWFIDWAKVVPVEYGVIGTFWGVETEPRSTEEAPGIES
jgi:hypothetical protein